MTFLNKKRRRPIHQFKNRNCIRMVKPSFHFSFAVVYADLTVANVLFTVYASASPVKLSLRPFNQY